MDHRSYLEVNIRIRKVKRIINRIRIIEIPIKYNINFNRLFVIPCMLSLKIKKINPVMWIGFYSRCRKWHKCARMTGYLSKKSINFIENHIIIH